MKTIIATVHLDVPEDMAENVLRLAGTELATPIDRDLALLAAACRQIPAVVREFLLAPEHLPPVYGKPIQFSTPNSPSQLYVTVHNTGPEPATPAPAKKRARRKTPKET